MPTVQFGLFWVEERKNRKKNTSNTEKAKGTEKDKQTFNPRRGYELCLHAFQCLIVAAGATEERNTCNLSMHYI